LRNHSCDLPHIPIAITIITIKVEVHLKASSLQHIVKVIILIIIGFLQFQQVAPSKRRTRAEVSSPVTGIYYSHYITFTCVNKINEILHASDFLRFTQTLVKVSGGELNSIQNILWSVSTTKELVCETR